MKAHVLIVSETWQLTSMHVLGPKIMFNNQGSDIKELQQLKTYEKLLQRFAVNPILFGPIKGDSVTRFFYHFLLNRYDLGPHMSRRKRFRELLRLCLIILIQWIPELISIKMQFSGFENNFSDSSSVQQSWAHVTTVASM